MSEIITGVGDRDETQKQKEVDTPEFTRCSDTRYPNPRKGTNRKDRFEGSFEERRHGELASFLLPPLWYTISTR